MNCIVIHGGPLTDIQENPHYLHMLYWQPWIKNELEKQGVTCDIPPMPNPWVPRYLEWKEELEKYNIDEETILIGHSRAAAFLVRWLGETKQHVRKLIVVAPNLKTQSLNPVVRDFYSFNIDPTIQTRVADIFVFTSENDDLENRESAQFLAQELQCNVVSLPHHGHYITEDMGSDEFPELLNCILR